MDGIGSNQMWGLTPALDVQQAGPAVPASAWSDSLGDTINVLLVGTCDARHILQTVCAARRHRPRKLHFFVYDETLECLARHILLLAVAMDRELTIPERGQLLLELHGNALLRSKTRSYLADKATEMLKALAAVPTAINGFDLTLLKHKERDALEDVLRFWRAAKHADFDMLKLRETRTRHLFKERYDHRFNLIDWDYTMRVQPEASILHFLHYSHFRDKGLAYELRECEYSEPNYTLASRMEGKSKAKGEPVSVRGYWGDIVCGPFAAFAVEADEERLYEKGSMQHKHSDLDVAEYNLTAMLVEFETGQKYRMPADKFAAAAPAPASADAGAAESGAAEAVKPSGATLEVIDEDDEKQSGDNHEAPSASRGAVEPNEVEAEVMRGHRDVASARPAPPPTAPVTATVPAPAPAAAASPDALSPIEYTVSLMCGDFNGILGKARFQRFFERAVFGVSAPTKVSSELNAVLASPCLVTLDSAKYLYLLKDEQKVAYRENLDAQAAAAGWRRAGDGDSGAGHGAGHRSFVFEAARQ